MVSFTLRPVCGYSPFLALQPAFCLLFPELFVLPSRSFYMSTTPRHLIFSSLVRCSVFHFATTHLHKFTSSQLFLSASIITSTPILLFESHFSNSFFVSTNPHHLLSSISYNFSLYPQIEPLWQVAYAI
jgi:hypothetical protein